MSNKMHSTNADDADFGFVWTYLLERQRSDKEYKTRLNLAIQKYKGPMNPSFMMNEISKTLDTQTMFKVTLNQWFQRKNAAFAEFDTILKQIENRLAQVRVSERETVVGPGDDFRMRQLTKILEVLDNPSDYYAEIVPAGSYDTIITKEEETFNKEFPTPAMKAQHIKEAPF